MHFKAWEDFKKNAVLILFSLVQHNCMYSQKTLARIEFGSLVAGDETTTTTGSATPPPFTTGGWQQGINNGFWVIVNGHQ